MKTEAFIGLYNRSDIMAKPWAENGYECHLFDLEAGSTQHDNIHFHSGDIFNNLNMIRWIMSTRRVKFMAAFPPCTDLSVSGAKHFDTKAKQDAFFWAKAMQHVYLSYHVGELIGCPYQIENPKSMVATLWRSADYTFNPCDYGGYLPADHINSAYPDIYPSMDAYMKETWLWTGGGFKMPTKLKVQPVEKDFPGFSKLGGKSERTKKIRALTPEGFARAIFEANGNCKPENVVI